MRRFLPEGGVRLDRPRRWLDGARRAIDGGRRSGGLRGRVVPCVVAAALAVGLAASAAPIRGPWAPGADGGATGPEASGESVAVAERMSGRTVGDAWRTKALEREREDVAERFARRFGISTGLAREIHDAAAAQGIEPEIAFGLVRTESSFRRTVVSWAGAVGYTQLLPSTAHWIAPGTSRSDLFDTRTNLRVGFKYLRYLVDKYHGDTRLALLAYNRGPGTVDRLLRQGGNPANGYARKVMSA